MGVLSRPESKPALAADRTPGVFARLAGVTNPGYLVAQGVNSITQPGYPADDALRGWVNSAPAFQPTLGQVGKTWRDQGLNQSSEFLTALQRGDIDAVLNSSLFPMGGMTVYHGSPHKFDAFDLSKIGTGEGAQAYGHGLYFAENPRVAKQYVKAGRNVGFDNRDGVPQYLSKSLAMTGGDRNKAAEILRTELARTKGEAKASNIRLALKDLAEGRGELGLYEVDIPDDQIAKMLDWDKPLSEQPEGVRKALESVREMYRANPSSEVPYLYDDMTGEQIYKELATVGYRKNGQGADHAKYASEQLRQLGIPGLKYFDGSSRKAGEGTRNLVLFDDKLAKILKRE